MLASSTTNFLSNKHIWNYTLVQKTILDQFRGDVMHSEISSHHSSTKGVPPVHSLAGCAFVLSSKLWHFLISHRALDTLVITIGSIHGSAADSTFAAPRNDSGRVWFPHLLHSGTHLFKITSFLASPLPFCCIRRHSNRKTPSPPRWSLCTRPRPKLTCFTSMPNMECHTRLAA